MVSSLKLAVFASSIALLLVTIGVTRVECASLKNIEDDFQSSSGLLDLNRFENLKIEINGDLEMTEDEFIKYLVNQIIPSYLKDFFALNLDPQGLVEDFAKLNVSSNCVAHSLEWIYRVSKPSNETVENWVVHMIDAWGKLPDGMLSGHVNSFGDFDECIELKAKDVTFLAPGNQNKNIERDFNGRYCTMILVPGKKITSATNNKTRISVSPEELLEYIRSVEGVRIYPSVGTCFPSSCAQEDVVKVFSFILGKLNEVNPYFSVTSVVSSCSVYEHPEFDSAVWGVIGMLSFIVGLTVLATIVDYFIRDNEKSAGKDKDKPKSKPGTGLSLILAFSLITNIQKWQSVGSGGGENFGCLHGMRFFSMLWVIMAHTWLMTTYIPSWNNIDVKTIQNDWTILTVLNATIAVDTFFVMGGFLVAYSLLKMFQKSKGRFNFYPMYVIHRYLRLTPTYAILVGIMATLIPYFGRGPYWEIMNTWSGWCRENWWTNLLYINNVVHSDKLCQAEAWYLSDDMQYYILTPFLIYPLWRSEVAGTILLAFVTLLSIAAPGIHSYYINNDGYDNVPTLIGTRHSGKYYQNLYIVPWDRAQTYIVGLWLGFIFYKLQGVKIQLNKFVVMAGWLISTAITASVLYGIYPYFKPEESIPDAVTILYGALHRFAFGISIAWIIFACVKGYGGYANKFLSWAPFVPLGRLTFSTYLVSIHIQMTLHLRFRQPLSYDNYTMLNLFFAHIVMSLLAGFVCTIILESPFIQLEKLIMPAPARSQPATKPPAKRYGINYNTMETILTDPKLELDSSNNNNNNNNADKVTITIQ